MKNTTDHYDRVKTFMKLAGQDTPDEPIFPSLEIRKLRATLILEEAMETIYALGFCVQEGSKDNEFIVREKQPLQTYTGPSAFGSISVKYPKTWSAYVDETNSSTPVDGYFHPRPSEMADSIRPSQFLVSPRLQPLRFQD